MQAVADVERPTGQGEGRYAIGAAWRWLRAWPELHEYAYRRPCDNAPPPSNLYAWSLEYLLCVKSDLEQACRSAVPREYLDCTVWRWRDAHTKTAMSERTRRRQQQPLSPSTCWRFSWLGAVTLLAKLSGLNTQEVRAWLEEREDLTLPT